MLNVFKKVHLNRRYKYLLYSIVMGGALFYSLISPLPFFQKAPLSFFLEFMLLLSILGVVLVHFPNVTFKNALLRFLLPVLSLWGAVFFYYYFSNFSLLFKLTTLAFYISLFYIILLADNILIVVSDRQEVIPLYRAAVTWIQILIILVAIPLFSGIYKLSMFLPIYQIVFISTLSSIFTLYMLIGVSYEEGVVRISWKSRGVLSIFVGFVVGASSMSMLFIPGEDFLRALFSSTVLMFGLSYTSAFLKNKITKGLIFQYFFLILIFLFLFLTFSH